MTTASLLAGLAVLSCAGSLPAARPRRTITGSWGPATTRPCGATTLLTKPAGIGPCSASPIGHPARVDSRAPQSESRS